MSKYTLYLAGDSTVQDVDQKNSNEMGWGQQLPTLFTKDIQIINKAIGGRSTKSFIEQGRLQELLEQVSEGDYLFIQFGHNDQKLEDPERGTLPYEDYQENLKIYIESARKQGVIPILVTPVQRRTFDTNGHLTNSLGEYPLAMKEISKSLNVPLIDLWEKSKQYYELLGPERTKALFAWYELEEPTGKPDNTHFSAHGAMEIAKLVVEGMEQLDLPFSQYKL